MEQVIFNLYPIFKAFIILFATVGVIDAIKSIANLISRGYKDKLDNKKDMHAKDCDTDVMQDLIQSMQIKYPDVNQNFIIKTEKEQNIENNQEIHEINKKLLEFEDIIKDLKNAHRN